MSVDLDQTPRSLLVCDRSSFLNEKNRISSQVEQLHFNYKVSLLLPECSSAPSHLDAVFNSFNSFYLIRNMPIYELLDKHFLKTAVYQGSVYGVSYRTRIDEDNCVALMPNGHLSLSLDKDSFELLGVEGKPSRFNHRTTCRYVVCVDLTDSSMAPGGRGYQRLLTGLRSRLQLKTDFLLSHHPGGGASLQDLLSRYDWSEHRPDVSSHTLTDLSCPALQSCDLQSCDPHSLLEWIGAVDAHISCRLTAVNCRPVRHCREQGYSFWITGPLPGDLLRADGLHPAGVGAAVVSSNIDSENSSSSFLSSLVCPEPKTTVSRALSVSVCGLLLPQDVHRLIQQIRYYLEQPRLESWVSLTVHGFVDSPVSWRGNEHGVLRGGENFYSLLIFHDQTYQLHLATGAHDTCPP
ncbi:ribonuclease P protein subunit p40 isoform X2 [Sparus aurata]|uniref:ribonuclease P protein subunit p40 isoform X2 n=1 Tax=Sparus aurata TaxID=8175 RepID=UPI0011C138FB|nr:ribonuclease P protein subunit p40 isoform X2 [Sparus aurata]